MAKKTNLFEMGAHFDNDWNSNNKPLKPSRQPNKILAPEKHLLHFAKEKRRGKTVTIVQPFYREKSELQVLLQTLKKKLGTGGTLKESCLEFQGEVQAPLKTHLQDMGYRLKP
jgi:translation initiation factor 1